MCRAGLYLGAAVFGLWCAAWIQYFSGAPLYAGIGNPRPAYALVFVVLGVVLAVVSHNRPLRAAWFVFAIQHLLNALAAVLPSWSGVWGANVLTGLFAVLLIIAGARRRPARVLVVAIAVFVAAAALRIIATNYAKRVRNGYSVISCDFREPLPKDFMTPPVTLTLFAAST
jgi:hypothetical protein